jgi:hypothetical protein
MRTELKILSLAAALCAAPAFAGNDGPRPSPMPPMPAPGPTPAPTVLADRTTACGFMCPQGDYNGVRILTDGSVISFSGKRNLPQPEKRVTVAHIEAGVMAKLEAEANQIVAGDLKDEQQGQPECMDAPTTTYQARVADGSMVKIEQDFGCHKHKLDARNDFADHLARVLDGMALLPQP